MNDIGVVEIESTRALFFDPYTENRATGSFILIDPQTNHTAAAGMIRPQPRIHIRSHCAETPSRAPQRPQPRASRNP